MSSESLKWKSWFPEVTCKPLIKGRSVARHVWFQAFLRGSCSRKIAERGETAMEFFSALIMSIPLFLCDLCREKGFRSAGKERGQEAKWGRELHGGSRRWLLPSCHPSFLRKGAQCAHTSFHQMSPWPRQSSYHFCRDLSLLQPCQASLPPTWQRSISWQSGERRGAETAMLVEGVLPSLSSGKKELVPLSVSLPLPSIFLRSQCHTTHSPPSLPPEPALLMSLRRVIPHHSGGKQVEQGTRGAPWTLSRQWGAERQKWFELSAHCEKLCQVRQKNVGSAQHKLNEFGELEGI